MFRKLLFLAAFVTCFSGTANAFSNALPSSTLGNVTTFGTGTVGGGTLGTGAVSFASDGTLLAKSPVTFNGPGAVKVGGEVAAKVSKLGAAKAIAKFAFKALPGALLVLSTAELLDELGFGHSPVGTTPTITKQGPDTGVFLDTNRMVSYPSGQAACRGIADAQGREGYNGHLYVAGTRYPDGVFRAPGSCDSPSAGGSYCGGCIRQTSSTPGTVAPANQQQLEDAIATKSGWPTSSSLARAAQDALDSGEVVEAEPQTVTGPATTPGGKTTTSNPDGSTTTTTTTNNYTYEGNKVTVTTTTITQNFSPTGVPVGPPTVTTTEPVLRPSVPVTPAPVTPAPAPAASAPKDVIVCGLPTTPKCSIDETGTPTGPAETFTQPKSDIDAAKSAAESAIGNAASISAPVWSFTFQLPTGCAPYVTGLRGVVLNVCQYQSTMHSLLSAIWAAATVFAMIGMVGRTIRES